MGVQLSSSPGRRRSPSVRPGWQHLSVRVSAATRRSPDRRWSEAMDAYARVNRRVLSR
jgi:hypothetical protein